MSAAFVWAGLVSAAFIMIIKLTDSADGSQITVVHGSGQASGTYAQGPTGPGLTFSSNQQVQITPLTRSLYAQVLPRTNHQAAFPFGALWSFTTLSAARMFAADHALDVQGLTRLKITDGTDIIKLHGALSRCDAAVKGVSVSVQYEFTYGKVEETTS